MSGLAVIHPESTRGELLDAFQQRALAIAASAAAPNTRPAYASAYRSFIAFLTLSYGEASPETFTLEALAAWRDELAARKLAPASIAQRVSAVRRLAAALAVDPLVQSVRCTQVQRERPRALSDQELTRLISAPNQRTKIGQRDHAILLLLARAGLRRGELARLQLADVRECERQPDGRRRPAVARRGQQTPLEVVVRYSKRGRTRTVPLHSDVIDALREWFRVRPTADTDALFVSLRRRRSDPPRELSPAAVGGIVARHAVAAGVREDRVSAHSLRHTFCTMLAERDVALEVIRELAGHADVRTTLIYVNVSPKRLVDGIAALESDVHPLAA